MFLSFRGGRRKLLLSFKLQDMSPVRYRVGAHKTSRGNKLPPTFPPAHTAPFEPYVTSSKKLPMIQFQSGSRTYVF